MTPWESDSWAVWAAYGLTALAALVSLWKALVQSDRKPGASWSPARALLGLVGCAVFLAIGWTLIALVMGGGGADASVRP